MAFKVCPRFLKNQLWLQEYFSKLWFSPLLSVPSFDLTYQQTTKKRVLAWKLKIKLWDDDVAGHIDNWYDDVCMHFALLNENFTPFCRLYASLASSTSPPKPFLHARNFSNIWFFWSDFRSSSWSNKLELRYNKKLKNE